ncbi:hypothetical protein RJG79_08500 [Mycoplasmatota bacterium WC44]
MRKFFVRFLLIIVIFTVLYFSLTRALYDDHRYYNVRSIKVYNEELKEHKNVSLWRSVHSLLFFVGRDAVLVYYKDDNYCIELTSRKDEYLMIYEDNVYTFAELLNLGYLEIDDLKKIRYPMRVYDLDSCRF